MRRLLQWFRSRPWWSAVAGVGMLGAGLHCFLNWRAEQRWKNYCAEAQARGVRLWYAEFAPPAIPDDQNFAALPMFRSVRGKVGLAATAFALPRGLNPKVNSSSREKVDWASCQAAFLKEGFIQQATDDPVRDTLLGLEHYAPQIQEWAEWRRRPQSRFPLELQADPRNISFPHLGVLMNATKIFCLKARAHLALHEPGAALESSLDAWQAYPALEQEPTLLVFAIRMALVGRFTAVVGDGLMLGVWTESELAELDKKLAAIHPVEDYRWAFTSERGYTNTYADALIAKSPTARAKETAEAAAASAALGFPEVEVPFPNLLFTCIPRRVYRENQLRSNHYLDELLQAVSADGTRLDLDHVTPSSPDRIKGTIGKFYAQFGGMSSAMLASMKTIAARTKTAADTARIAVALERYRLRNGAYPADLQRLEPEFIPTLPRDVYSGGAYHYRPDSAGTFLLYAVGSNRVDDGGAEKSDDVWIHAPARAER